MRGIFCGTPAKNVEEFKKNVKGQILLMSVLTAIGIIVAAISFYVLETMETELSEEMRGVYCGVGCGVAIAGLFVVIKNIMLLRNEAKLKEKWLERVDERLATISAKALRVATAFLIIGIYAVALIGGMFYPILVKALMIVIFLFVLAYLCAYQYYNRKM